LKELEADEAAADREEGFVDVVAAFVSDAQPSVLVQPGDRALDDPPLCPKARSVPALRPGDLRLDVTAAELAASFARVVGTVAIESFRPATWPAAAAAHGRDRVDERDKLGDVIAVAAGERGRKRRPAPTGDDVML
jgi:hypothetical protein